MVEGSCLFIEIDGWQTNIRFSSAHLVFDHEHCQVLHGHSYAIHVKITGDTTPQGLIIDFSELKTKLRKIAEELDHRVLLPEQNINVKRHGKQVHLTVIGKEYSFPIEDCMLLPMDQVTAENLASYILTVLMQRVSLPENIHEIVIGVDEGPGQGAFASKKL
jgi:6-pyruvoyltetrahydropterin/6-carboxytetrahydropterin synthase